MKPVKEGITILHNNATNSTFIASSLDEEVQTGTRDNDKHIEWVGELDIKVYTDPREPQEQTEGLDKEWELHKQETQKQSKHPEYDKMVDEQIQAIKDAQKKLLKQPQSNVEGLDLEKMGRKLDEVLADETPESMTKWLLDYREKHLSKNTEDKTE